MGGTTESIHYGVPMVAIPVFGDQPSNAAAIEESGFGTTLDFNDFTKDTLVAAIRKVLSQEFREQSTRVSKAWHDRPMSPIDTAIYWTEYAARNANFTFRTAAADTPLYQHVYIDVAVVLLVFGGVFLFVLKLLVMMTCCRSNSKDKKVDRRKKQK